MSLKTWGLEEQAWCPASRRPSLKWTSLGPLNSTDIWGGHRTFQQKCFPIPFLLRPDGALLRACTEPPDHPEGTFHGVVGLGLGRWGMLGTLAFSLSVLAPVLQQTQSGESTAVGGGFQKGTRAPYVYPSSYLLQGSS